MPSRPVWGQEGLPAVQAGLGLNAMFLPQLPAFWDGWMLPQTYPVLIEHRASFLFLFLRQGPG